MDAVIVFVARAAAPGAEAASAGEREVNGLASAGEEVDIGVDVADELAKREGL